MNPHNFIPRRRAASVRAPQLFAFLVFALAGCSSPAADDAAAGPKASNGPVGASSRAEFAEGELLVKFRAGQPRASVRAALQRVGGSTIKQFPRIGVTHVRVQGDVLERAAELSRQPSVVYAEPNYIVHAIETTPNDPSFDQLWGLHNTGQTGGTTDADIDAPEAWDVQTGNGQVIIGVIDTGIDLDHVDLVDNLWVNEAEANGVAGVDDDNNGYVDDIHGIDAITGTGDPTDQDGHGTHVSGTIGATGQNGIGVTGVSWDVQIAGCKFLNPSGTTDDAIECVEYFTALGVHATSNSWGGGGFSQALKDAIDAADDAGILFIAAAGNSSSDNDTFQSYPSSYTSNNIIAVASTDHNDQLSSFSSYGLTSVDVAAPGTDIHSTWNDGGYNTISGTSMATPHVSGLAALLWSQFPEAPHDEIKARLMLTVDPLGLEVASGGRINAHRALTADLSGPFLLSYDPRAGGSGETLTLGGLNFGDAQGSGIVQLTGLGDEPAECLVTTWSDTEIVCVVPTLDDGEYEVAVTTDAGDTSASVVFTVIQPLYTEQLAAPQFLGGGTAQGWQQLDGCWTYSLPFTFNYYEVDYSSVYVCSNGFLDFTNSSPTYTNSESGLIARTMIAPVWDDLDTSNGDIYIHQPSATSVAFRWDAETYAGAHPINVEVILEATDGSIQFNYGAGNTGLTPTVGISEGNALRYHLAPHDGATSLTDAQSVIYTRGPGLILSGTNLSQVTCASSDLDNITVTVNAAGGYDGPALVSLVDLPDGFSGSLNELLTPPAQATAQVSVGAVASGDYQFGIQASGAEIPDRTIAVDVQVVAAVPDAPELTQPADGESGVSTAPTFTWSSASTVDEYVIEVAQDASFDNVLYTATVEGTSHRVTSALPRLTTLYWRVRASNVCGTGTDSPGQSFTTSNEICLAPGVDIPDGISSGVNDSVIVTDEGLIADLDVRLGVSIGFVGDVAFTLTHEDTGTSVVFYDQPGVPDSTYGCDGTDIDATFDDASETPVETECGGTVPSIQGVLKPNNPLAAFNGETVAGTWTINARDLAGGYEGTLDEWCLSVVVPVCGDGVVEGDEACDDGNDDETDACLSTCVAASCGDGFTYEGTEECDDGAANSDTTPDACRTSCILPFCGDDVLDSDEACDYGDDNSDTEPNSCRTTCAFASCGDGVVDNGETCDSGEANSDTAPDACRTTCTPAFCGDGVADSGEACDQGDANSNVVPDACRTSCVLPYCGDGVNDTPEQCDSGANNSDTTPDACRTTCLNPSCGDGVNDTPEQCDDGAENSDTEPNACRTACLVASCGDGVIDSAETCDNGDGNSDSTPDACRTTCEPASCGDAVTDSGEQCDDGDANSDTDPDACRLLCVAPSCGDGVTDSTEQCDDGHANSDSAPDACRTTCALAACGDGVTDSEEDCDASGESELCDVDCTDAECGDETVNETAGEACDDGQETADCDFDCTEVECGDETVNVSAGEACDDGNDDDTDECLTICISSTCGDGFVQTEVEECDDGENNSDELADACRENCMPAWCGDGVIDTGEGCDDGAENSDYRPDACRTDCFAAYCGDGIVDTGETCDDGADNSDTEASACRTSCLSASCGDGVIDEGEQCDDGAANGDDETCSSVCELKVSGGRCTVQWASPRSSTPTAALGAMIAILGLVLRRRRR